MSRFAIFIPSSRRRTRCNDKIGFNVTRLRGGDSRLGAAWMSITFSGPSFENQGRVQMRCPIKEFPRITALLCGLALTGYAQGPTKTLRAVPNFATVTDQMMRAPKPENWQMHRGNYQAWGYSPLDQINKANVKTLQLVWSRAMEPGANEATPLVYNGVMYLGNPADVVQAIDAATGHLMWEHRHPPPPAGSLR